MSGVIIKVGVVVVVVDTVGFVVLCCWSIVCLCCQCCCACFGRVVILALELFLTLFQLASCMFLSFMVLSGGAVGWCC